MSTETRPEIPRSPRHDDLRARLMELYALVVALPVPSDQVIATYFRHHRQLPPGARGFLAATAYALLRQRVRLMHQWQWAGLQSPRFPWDDPGEIPRALPPGAEGALAVLRWLMEDMAAPRTEALKLVASALDAAATWPPNREFPDDPRPPGTAEALNSLRPWSEDLEADRDLRHAPPEVQLAARLSLPGDMLARWVARFGEEETAKLAKALAEPAPLDLRANSLKGTRDELAKKLEALEYPTLKTLLSPHGLRVIKKANLFKLDLFDEGLFEVQDEGSQLVALGLDPKPNWRVLDACAGGGGKTLHLAALMENRGEIFAHDTDAERLEPARKRLRRAGIHNVRFAEPGQAAAVGPFDAVLIDAPCLGLGTLRRNPGLAWRGPLQRRLGEVEALQRACLESYAPLVKPGGSLLYAVCSFEAEETLDLLPVIEAMGFKPSPLGPRLVRNGVRDLAEGLHHLTLLPHVHGTDGFFMARFERLK